MSPRNRRPAIIIMTVAAVLGALIWGAWLGWDTTASYDVITGTVQDPYVTLQVLGCALTVGVVTAVLAGRGHPAAAAAGVSLGFWLGWTTHAAATDGTGLYLVGSMILAIGLAGGTTLAALAGTLLRSAMDAVRRRREARDTPSRPATGAS